MCSNNVDIRHNGIVFRRPFWCHWLVAGYGDIRTAKRQPN